MTGTATETPATVALHFTRAYAEAMQFGRSRAEQERLLFNYLDAQSIPAHWFVSEPYRVQDRLRIALDNAEAGFSALQWSRSWIVRFRSIWERDVSRWIDDRKRLALWNAGR